MAGIHDHQSRNINMRENDEYWEIFLSVVLVPNGCP
jgi:hypothetical protein